MITRANADAIRAEIASGTTRRMCAARFHLSLSQVDRIVNGQSWVGRPFRARKITDTQVAWARAQIASGVKAAYCAAVLGVSHTLISLISQHKRR